MPSLRQSLIAKLLRHYPLYSGAGTLANSKLVTRLAGASHENAWCPTAGGEVLARLDDYVGRAAFYCGDLDPKITWTCQRLVKPGDTVCDIGANIGIVTMLLSHLVGRAGRVFSFEPNPRSFDALTAAVDRNQASNIYPQQFALGAQTEERNLSIPAENAGAASLRGSRANRGEKLTPVSVRSLDDFVDEYKIERIEFMKIDVEGFESEVFKGSQRVLESIRPKAILFELNERFGDVLIKHPVFNILAEHRYSFFYLPKATWKMRAVALDPQQTASFPGHDVIAIAEGTSSSRAAADLNANA